MIAQIHIWIDYISTTFEAYKSFMGIGLGFIFALSKLFSTEKPPVIIAQVQWVFDTAAKMLLKLGNFSASVAKFLSEILKSNGYLGKE